MHELKSLSDSELIARNEKSVADERRLTGAIIEQLREIELRRLHAKLGYSSLFEYCTQHLKYCPASAQLRIDAMRFARDVPQVQAALDQGTVALSTVAMLQKFVRHERKRTRAEIAPEAKRDLFEKIENKSKAEAERVLLAISPAGLPRERARALTETETEIRFVANERIMTLIEKMRDRLRASGNLDPAYAEVFERALEVALGEKRERRAARSPGELKVDRRRPYIRVADRRAAGEKTGGQCTFVSTLTGRRCQQQTALQIEHIFPFAKGGGSTAENLTLLCGTHNRLRAIEAYGLEKMAPFLKS